MEQILNFILTAKARIMVLWLLIQVRNIEFMQNATPQVAFNSQDDQWVGEKIVQLI